MLLTGRSNSLPNTRSELTLTRHNHPFPFHRIHVQETSSAGRKSGLTRCFMRSTGAKGTRSGRRHRSALEPLTRRHQLARLGLPIMVASSSTCTTSTPTAPAYLALVATCRWG